MLPCPDGRCNRCSHLFCIHPAASSSTARAFPSCVSASPLPPLLCASCTGGTASSEVSCSEIRRSSLRKSVGACWAIGSGTGAGREGVPLCRSRPLGLSTGEGDVELSAARGCRQSSLSPPSSTHLHLPRYSTHSKPPRWAAAPAPSTAVIVASSQPPSDSEYTSTRCPTAKPERGRFCAAREAPGSG